MYKGRQNKSDFMARTASHATKGSKRGFVRDLPKEAIEQFILELEEFAKLAKSAVNTAGDNLEMARANLKAVKSRLKSAYAIRESMRNSLVNLNESAHIRGWSIGRRKGALRSMHLFNLANDAVEQLKIITNALSRQIHPMQHPTSGTGGRRLGDVDTDVKRLGANNTDAVGRLGGNNTDDNRLDERRDIHTQETHGYGQHNSHNQHDYERGN